MRIGTNGGVKEIMAHPFFDGIDWDELGNGPTPCVPELSSPTDTRHFEEYENEEEEDMRDMHHTPKRRLTSDDIPFIGYTFKSFDAVKARFETINSMADLNSLNSLQGPH